MRFHPAYEELLARRDPRLGRSRVLGCPSRRVRVGLSLNPIEDVGDVVSTAGDVVSSVASGAGDAVSYGAGVVTSTVSAFAHAITNPSEIPGDLIKIIAHPGALASPGVFAAFMSLGPVGLAYAWASDRTGATQLVASALDAAGGIYFDYLLRPACTAVSLMAGVPELAFGCMLASVSYDIARAIIDGDVSRLIDALRVVVQFTLAYGIDLNSAISAVMESVFKIVGSDVGAIFGGLDKLAVALDKISPGLGAKVVSQISKAADQIQAKATAYAQAAAKQGINTGLGALAQATSKPKVSGAQAIAGGLAYGSVPSMDVGVDTIGPFGPDVLRRYAAHVNTIGAAFMTRPMDEISAGQVVLIMNSALGIVRPNQLDDFASMFSPAGKRAVFAVQTVLRGSMKNALLSRLRGGFFEWLRSLFSFFLS